MRPSRIHLFVLGLGLALLGGCSDPAPPGRPERVRVVVADYLTDPAGRKVELEREDAPVLARTVGPRPVVRGARTVLPALAAAPPSRIHLEIPEGLHPDAAIQLAAGVDASAYSEPANGAQVRFRVSIDGKERSDTRLDFGSEVPRKNRVWNESEFPLKGARRVTLETELVPGSTPPADPDRLVEAAWGLVQIVAPREVRRHEASVESPNLVLILIDTLRADRLGCYGYEKPTSPHIDGLAARGLLFDRAYSAAPWTWPSTASILTSLPPPAHGLDSPASCFLAHELETLPEVLLRAGLHTVGFSANPLVSAAHNFHQGFEQFAEYGLVPAAEVLPDVERWLRDHAGERFFLYLHIADPHGPYEPDLELAGHLVGPEPDDYALGASRELFEKRAAGEPFDRERLERIVAHHSTLYDGEVFVSDHAVGRVLGLLAELGVADRTVVAVTSDHGEEFLEHGYAGHTKQVYDELVRVPLVIAGPGVPTGTVEGAPVENRFLPQTLLALAGIDASGFPDERTLLDEDALRRFASEPIFVSTQTGRWLDERGVDTGEVGPIYGVRYGERAFQWAPIESGPDDDRVRYFELAADPDMLHDRSAERAEQIPPFQRMVLDWLKRSAESSPGRLMGGRGTMEMLEELGYVNGE